jgi:hypothetical protein
MKLLTSEPGTARTTENGRVIEVGRRRRESRRDAQRDSSLMAEELFFDGGLGIVFRFSLCEIWERKGK